MTDIDDGREGLFTDDRVITRRAVPDVLFHRIICDVVDEIAQAQPRWVSSFLRCLF